MKTLIVRTIALSVLISPLVLAQGEHAGHQTDSSMSSAHAPMTNGVVKRVDKASGKVTLAHGPLANLGMPAMTMSFRVKDAAWLDQMKAGDKLRFVADDVNGVLTVIRFEAAQ